MRKSGMEIRDYIFASKYTIDDIVAKTGCSRRAIYYLCNGTYRSKKVINELAKLYGITPNEIKEMLPTNKH